MKKILLLLLGIVVLVTIVLTLSSAHGNYTPIHLATGVGIVYSLIFLCRMYASEADDLFEIGIFKSLEWITVLCTITAVYLCLAYCYNLPLPSWVVFPD